MNRVLITGASGYVGQHLAKYLAEAGWQVRGLARAPRPATLAGIEWVHGDVTDAALVQAGTAGCTAVVHLACLPLNASTQNPAEALRINAGGTLSVLQAAQQAQVERVVYLSTGQVYGGRAPLPSSEAQLPEPHSFYAASKLSGELWGEAFAQAHGLPVLSLRVFNIYGSALDGAPRPTVETRMAERIRQGLPPRVRGNPQNGRDFIQIQDVVRAIALALGGPARRGVVNVGTGVLTTLTELARLLIDLMGSHLEAELEDDGQPAQRFQADTTRASAELGFRAEIALPEGLLSLVRTLETA